MKIDLFNKKRIKFLEGKIEKLWYNLSQKEKTMQELQNKPIDCFKDGYTGENTTLSMIGGHVKAIEKYLKIDVITEFVDDPQYDKPLPKKMMIYVAKKEVKV
jgi:hypothetical protein